MSTELVQLFPSLKELKRAEKLYVIQFLVSKLAQAEATYPTRNWLPGMVAIWRGSNDALAEEQEREHA